MMKECKNEIRAILTAYGVKTALTEQALKEIENAVNENLLHRMALKRQRAEIYKRLIESPAQPC